MSDATVRKFNCPSCGAPLKISSIENGYVQCRFCGAQAALQGEFFSNIKNEEWKERDFKSGLPVTINRKDRHTALVNTITKDPFFPVDVLTRTVVKKEECIGVICYFVNYEVAFHKDATKNFLGITTPRKDEKVNGRLLVCGTTSYAQFINAMFPDIDQVKFRLKDQLDFPKGFTIVDNDVYPTDAHRYVPQNNISTEILAKHKGFNIDRFTVSDVVFPICLTYFDVTLDYYGEEIHFFIRSDGQQILCNWMPHDENLKSRIDELNKKLRYTPKTIQHEEEYYEEVPVNTVTPVTETSKKKPSKAVDAALIMTGIATGGALMPLVAGGIIANHAKAKNTETKYVNETKIEKVKKKRTISEKNPEYYELKRQLSELTDSINNTKSQYLSGERFLNGIYNNSDKPFAHIGDDGYKYKLVLEKVGNDEDSVMDLLINEFTISYRQAISIIDDLPHNLKGSYSKADCDRIVNALRDAGATVSIVQTND